MTKPITGTLLGSLIAEATAPRYPLFYADELGDGTYEVTHAAPELTVTAAQAADIERTHHWRGDRELVFDDEATPPRYLLVRRYWEPAA